MTKFLARLGSEKITCRVFLCVHNIEADVKKPITDMTLIFSRGP